MHITMPILADGLSKFRIETAIAPNAGELRGIRLGGNLVSDQYVHIIQNAKDVICCCGSDYIKVFDATVDVVFNEVSSLNERLHNWEDELKNCIFNGGTLHDLLMLGSEVLNNPIFILDQREIVFAMTDHAEGSVDPEWDYMMKHGRMPFNRVSAIYHNTNIKNIRRSSEYDGLPFIFNPPGMTHRGIIFRIPDPQADSFLGTMVIVENRGPFTEGSLHLSRTLIKSVVKWTEIHKNDHNMKNISYLFTDLLNGAEISEEEINLHKALNELDNEVFFLAVIPPMSGKSQQFLGPMLEAELAHCRCFEYEENLLVLCPADQNKKELIESLQSVVDDMQIRIGISFPFSDWRAMRSAFKQANIALSFSENKLSKLSSVSAMSYLISELSTALHGSEVIHPALIILKEYDRLHATQYFNTLFAYLKFERNLVRTAAALFIHRNSLVYRISRIQELIVADLDDFEVRAYLVLSYLCYEEGSRGIQSSGVTL